MRKLLPDALSTKTSPSFLGQDTRFDTITGVCVGFTEVGLTVVGLRVVGLRVVGLAVVCLTLVGLAEVCLTDVGLTEGLVD